MGKRVAMFVAAFVVIAGIQARAQDGVRIVVTGFGGWSMAEGIKGKDFLAPNGETYNQVNPTDSGHFGFSIGVAEGNGEWGFMYRRQQGQLAASGSATTTIGDMATNNYHGYLGYYFGNPAWKVQPFVNAGAGATSYSSVSYTTAGGASGSIVGFTEFSATFGAGVRAMLTDSFGLRFGLQWTPIYISLDPSTSWCDPSWGCYLVGNSQYANQVEFAVGVTYRFGR